MKVMKVFMDIFLLRNVDTQWWKIVSPNFPDPVTSSLLHCWHTTDRLYKAFQWWIMQWQQRLQKIILISFWISDHKWVYSFHNCQEKYTLFVINDNGSKKAWNQNISYGEVNRVIIYSSDTRLSPLPHFTFKCHFLQIVTFPLVERSVNEFLWWIWSSDTFILWIFCWGWI